MSKGPLIEGYVRDLRDKLRENPGCALTHYNLGIALLKQHKWDEAISEFEEAIDESPRMVEAYINLSGIYFQKGEIEKGIHLCKKVIEFRPDFAIAYGNLGFLSDDLALNRVMVVIKDLDSVSLSRWERDWITNWLMS